MTGVSQKSLPKAQKANLDGTNTLWTSGHVLPPGWALGRKFQQDGPFLTWVTFKTMPSGFEGIIGFRMMKKMQTACLFWGILLSVGCNSPRTKTSAPPKRMSTAQLVEKYGGSIVTIMTMGEDGEYQGLGTGFFIDEEGTLVTNFHVIEGATKAKIKRPDEVLYDIANVLAFDKEKDIAILKATMPQKTIPLKLAGKLPMPGEDVTVIGSPLGLEQTITRGTFSKVRDGGGVRLLQFSAKLNPGNSGGPAFNAWGEVVGVATLKLEGMEGLGFGVYAEDVLMLQKKAAQQNQKPVPIESVDWEGISLAPSKPSGEDMGDSSKGGGSLTL